jgi:hypothetical protein
MTRRIRRATTVPTVERFRRNRAMSEEEKKANLLAHPVKGTLVVSVTLAIAGALGGALQVALDLKTWGEAVRLSTGSPLRRTGRTPGGERGAPGGPSRWWRRRQKRCE